MPIDYRIDPDFRVVFAVGRGALTPEDIFEYQHKVWSRADVAGYNELFDMSGVERIIPPSRGSVRDLASFAALMDPPDFLSKFAIVAPQDLAFGIGRMFESYRELDERSTKQVAVFRSMQPALAWLGMTRLRSRPKRRPCSLVGMGPLRASGNGPNPLCNAHLSGRRNHQPATFLAGRLRLH
jgi:hypothetical protein